MIGVYNHLQSKKTKLTLVTVLALNACRYRQLKLLNLQPSSKAHSWYVRFMYWVSIFTMASFRPVGSPPMARQNRITCITGRAKINSITPTFRHIRRKFFWRRALIFPVVVHSLQLPQSSHASCNPCFADDALPANCNNLITNITIR